MSPVQTCRHWDVNWLDTHTCNCNQCGKFGHWFEEGFVLWRRDRSRAQQLRAVRPQTAAYAGTGAC